MEDLKDLVEDTKRRPGEIVFTSSGLYGASHVPMEMFLRRPDSRCATCPRPAAVR